MCACILISNQSNAQLCGLARHTGLVEMRNRISQLSDIVVKKERTTQYGRKIRLASIKLNSYVIFAVDSHNTGERAFFHGKECEVNKASQQCNSPNIAFDE